MNDSDLLDRARALDLADPLSEFRAEFEMHDDHTLYLDGNSLGRMPKAARDALFNAIDAEWAGGLVESWEKWITLTRSSGDAVGAQLLGAPAGTTLIADSTSVNLFKLASAALDSGIDRKVVVTDRHDFPTDRYLMERLASARGGTVRWVESDPIEGLDIDQLRSVLDDEVALVCLSHVNYRSGAIADMAAVAAAAHEVGAFVLFDVSHSVGSVPIDVVASNADLVTGCTYKYLNSGPGAPAFLYVRQDLIEAFDAPLPGWFAQKDQFDMGPSFAPAPGIDRFQVGTPPILSATPIPVSAEMFERAGMDRVRNKSLALTDLLIELFDERLTDLGFRLGSPRDPSIRGGHITIAHDEALAISVALRQYENVVGDFRMPDGIRLAPVALYTRFEDIAEAVIRIERIMKSGVHLTVDANQRVT